ncbi:MAG: glycosyltransferase family 2 protein [Pseudanabaenaceae cyanobacterium]
MRFLTVNYQSVPEIRRLLASIAQVPGAHELWIVDNAQEGEALATLTAANVRCVLLDAGGNLGFGRACNLGLQRLWAEGRSPVWLINPDAWLGVNALAPIAAVLGKAPILGTTLQDEQGNCRFAGGRYAPHSGRIWEAPSNSPQWLSGASLVLDLARFRQCPTFDPDFFLYYEDFEFCQRYQRQGYPLHLVAAPVYHAPSTITGRTPSAKIRWQTRSYLLALHKVGPPGALLYRLGRIGLGCLHKPHGIAQAQAAGLRDYLHWVSACAR